MRNPRGGGSSLIWLLAAGGAAAAIYFYSKSTGTPAPLSIYPEYAYTAQTSMAATPQQKATAALLPTPLFSSVQQQEQAAILSQCAGSYPGCTILTADTQLGF